MKNLVVTILSFSILTSCYSQQDVFSNKHWKNDSFFLNIDSLQKSELVRQDYTVFSKKNKICVTQKKEKVPNNISLDIIKKTEQERFSLKGKRSFIKVDDGYLVGYFYGEWGGELYWFSKNGKEKYEISGNEIVQFIKRDNKIYAIEGLAHLNTSEGRLIEIKKINHRWTAFKCLKLPFAPKAISLDNKNNFVVITSNSLITVDVNMNIKTLIETEYWWWLYPNSLIIKNNLAYIGTRGGILRYDFTTKTQEWFVSK